jgi:predicted TIM-barrel fold metal-dependent hydrolase
MTSPATTRSTTTAHKSLPSAHELIASFPETTFVLEAAGWPVDLGDDGFASWTERLEAVSSFPNVAIKLQGVALIFGTTRELVEPWVATAVRIFGPTRAMFATHWPVDHLLWDIGTLVSTLRAILGDLTFEQEAEFLAGTARRVYGLAEPDVGGRSL